MNVLETILLVAAASVGVTLYVANGFAARDGEIERLSREIQELREDTVLSDASDPVVRQSNLADFATKAQLSAYARVSDIPSDDEFVRYGERLNIRNTSGFLQARDHERSEKDVVVENNGDGPEKIFHFVKR